MARWPALFALVLLAGCASPEAEVPGAGQVAQEEAAEMVRVPSQDVLEFDGGLLGAGYVVQDQELFAGTFTLPHEFTVRDGATRLEAVMTWSHAVPHDLVLALDRPDGSAINVHDPVSAVGQRLAHTEDAPVPGIWSAMGLAEGAAADVPYRIVVTVDYAAES